MALDVSTLAAVAGFSLVTSATPGPNTLMLANSSMRHGFQKTVPHLLGVNIGVLVMLVAVALGAGQIFFTYPAIKMYLKYIAIIYLAYLAGKILCSSCAQTRQIDSNPKVKPLSFWKGVAIQWVNPKVWMMCVLTMSMYPQPGVEYALSACWIALVFWIVNLPSIAIWVVGGSLLKKWLVNNLHCRIFNMVMSSLLVVTIVFMLFEN